MSGKRTEFIYLSEPDLIKLGVNNAARSTQVAEEVFGLLSDGDYLMGGSNHNSHGMGIVFPKETEFKNMPVAGPDRRFVAMPAYLGGRFDICGVKWYGSNAANPQKGLPRSVLTVILNDKDTGEPLCFMSANLISAMRTGAVPGVGTKYLARKNSETASVIGCGPINRSCFTHIAAEAKGLKKVFCFDIFEDKACEFADWIKKELNIDAVPVGSAEDAMRESDIVTIAASRLKPLRIEYAWAKKGAAILLSGPAKGDDALWLNSKIVYDNVRLHEAYVEEAIASGDKAGYYAGVIGGPIYELIDAGKLPALADSVSMGDIVRGKAPARANDDEVIIFVACGMAVFDLGWGYEMYQNALETGAGQRLTLWPEPSLM